MTPGPVRLQLLLQHGHLDSLLEVGRLESIEIDTRGNLAASVCRAIPNHFVRARR